MLRSLQHPCIVYLVGINIHPLCFALQLAPLGSLNTVLEEKRKGRGGSRGALSALYGFECRSKRSSCVTVAGCGYMPLGHMMTFKVAYQIAAGLAYLHRKSIIFCDLKSDNILVWSLEVRMEPVITSRWTSLWLLQPLTPRKLCRSGMWSTLSCRTTASPDSPSTRAC